jgi:hypothetical protein
MLIYLDSGHLAWLARADALARDRFMRAWRDAKCELAVSWSHIMEMGQLDSPGDVRTRAEVLDCFPVVRAASGSSVDIARWEIRNQLLSITKQPPHGTDQFRAMFLPVIDGVEVQEAAVRGHWIFQQMRAAFRQGAEAERLGKQVHRVPTDARLTQVPTDEQLREVKGYFLSQFEQDSPIREQALRMFDSVASRIQEGGPVRDVLVQVYGLEGLTAFPRIPDEDLSWVHVFMNRVREEAALLLMEAPEIGQSPGRIASQFDPYASPGIRLRLAVNRARKSHPKDPEPGDQVDEDHVMFAPYVDLLCTDKRVHTFLSQESKRSHGLLSFEDVRNVRRAKSLDDVMTQIVDETRRGWSGEERTAPN